MGSAHLTELVQVLVFVGCICFVLLFMERGGKGEFLGLRPKPIRLMARCPGSRSHNFTRSNESRSLASKAEKSEVAVCLVGAARTLYTRPVQTNMVRNLEPLSPYDVFAVFRGPDRHVSQYLIPIQPVVHMEVLPSGNPQGRTCKMQEELQQHCLSAILQREQSRSTHYSWIVKLRPDTLILKALPPLKWFQTSVAPSVLIPPFSELDFDPASCMRWQGSKRAVYDTDYRPCVSSELRRSKKLLTDQFAVIHRRFAVAYLNRTAPLWTYRPEGSFGADATESCGVLGFWQPEVQLGCECALGYSLRHMNDVVVNFVPFHVTLYRGKGHVHREVDFPRRAIAWALAAGCD